MQALYFKTRTESDAATENTLFPTLLQSAISGTDHAAEVSISQMLSSLFIMQVGYHEHTASAHETEKHISIASSSDTGICHTKSNLVFSPSTLCADALQRAFEKTENSEYVNTFFTYKTPYVLKIST